MKGEVVWRYKIPRTANERASITGIMILPNTNNVLYTIVNPSSMRGVYEVSRQGDLIWSFKDIRVSHDAVRLPNGNTLITAAHSEDLSPWPYADPQVFEVNSEGQIVWAWHAKDVFASDPQYKDVRGLRPGFVDWGPWTHVNGALRLPDGSTMISPRNFHVTIYVNEEGNLTKSFGDPCFPRCGIVQRLAAPHSPIPLSNGNLLISEPPRGRVVEFDGESQGVVWQWPFGGRFGDEGWLFIRAAQRLHNGNTLVVDSNGQLIEVTSDGQKVWALKCDCYLPSEGPRGKPFFQAERLSYMLPTFRVQEPVEGRTYANNTIRLTLLEGLDVGKITYSIHDNSKNVYVVHNATLFENVYRDSLTPPAKKMGPKSIDLPNGNYTLTIMASSTGFGYKAFVDSKRMNYVNKEISFLVNRTTAPEEKIPPLPETVRPAPNESPTPPSVTTEADPQQTQPFPIIVVLVVAAIFIIAVMTARRYISDRKST